MWPLKLIAEFEQTKSPNNEMKSNLNTNIQSWVHPLPCHRPQGAPIIPLRGQHSSLLTIKSILQNCKLLGFYWQVEGYCGWQKEAGSHTEGFMLPCLCIWAAQIYSRSRENMCQVWIYKQISSCSGNRLLPLSGTPLPRLCHLQRGFSFLLSSPIPLEDCSWISQHS